MSTPPLVELFVRDLQAVVEKYCNQGLTLAEAIGAFEILKLETFQDHVDELESESEGGVT